MNEEDKEGPSKVVNYPSGLKVTFSVRRLPPPITDADRVRAAAARLQQAYPTLTAGQAERRAAAVLDPDPARRDPVKHADAQRVTDDGWRLRTESQIQETLDRHPTMTRAEAVRDVSAFLSGERQAAEDPEAVVHRPATAAAAMEATLRHHERLSIDYLARHDQDRAMERDHGHSH